MNNLKRLCEHVGLCDEERQIKWQTMHNGLDERQCEDLRLVLAMAQFAHCSKDAIRNDSEGAAYGYAGQFLAVFKRFKERQGTTLSGALDALERWSRYLQCNGWHGLPPASKGGTGAHRLYADMVGICKIARDGKTEG